MLRQQHATDALSRAGEDLMSKKTESFSYNAIKIQQQPMSLPFYLLAAKATEILKWADVPRKKEHYMAGYQRELAGRHKRIADFLQQDTQNIIPGSIIIAMRDEYCKVEDQGTHCRISINVKDEPYEVLLPKVFHEFLGRLSESEKSSLDTLPREASEEELRALEDEDESDTPVPESYLARLTAEMKDALGPDTSLSQERRDAIREFVIGVTKPGLIMDGQHRVFGAKEVSEFDVVLPVVLIPGLPYREQVFQFYVLNNKAQPLKPTELRATISTSLTRKEIDELYMRLRKSGVHAEEQSWTHQLNTSPMSPFRGLVDFGFAEGQGVIKENVAFQIVTSFMKLGKKYRLLYKDIERWQRNDWDYKLRLFFHSGALSRRRIPMHGLTLKDRMVIDRFCTKRP